MAPHGSSIRHVVCGWPGTCQELPAGESDVPGIVPTGSSSRPRGSKRDETGAKVGVARIPGGRARAFRRLTQGVKACSATGNPKRPALAQTDPQCRRRTTRVFAMRSQSVPRRAVARRTHLSLARENRRPRRKQGIGRDSEGKRPGDRPNRRRLGEVGRKRGTLAGNDRHQQSSRIFRE